MNCLFVESSGMDFNCSVFAIGAGVTGYSIPSFVYTLAFTNCANETGSVPPALPF